VRKQKAAGTPLAAFSLSVSLSVGLLQRSGSVLPGRIPARGYRKCPRPTMLSGIRIAEIGTTAHRSFFRFAEGQGLEKPLCRHDVAIRTTIEPKPYNRPQTPWEKFMNAVTDTGIAEMPAPLVFTDSAADKVKQLIDEEGNPALKLRVFVQGGGCSGFQYGFTFDEEVNEDDTVMTKAGVQLLIDSMSYQYLVGAEIDYKDDINGAQFVIKNPNATTTCGCGSSFSV
jgi:iron-sulfur cluster insertion protein